MMRGFCTEVETRFATPVVVKAIEACGLIAGESIQIKIHYWQTAGASFSAIGFR
jgi:hypothetical protein